MLNRVMYASDSIRQTQEAMFKLNRILKEKPLPEAASPVLPRDGGIEFRDVTFAYPGMEYRHRNAVSNTRPWRRAPEAPGVLRGTGHRRKSRFRKALKSRGKLKRRVHVNMVLFRQNIYLTNILPYRGKTTGLCVCQKRISMKKPAEP